MNQTLEAIAISSRWSYNHNPRVNLGSSTFKYKQEGKDLGCNYNYECSVCLSVFEGEEVRQLPRCEHTFNAPCIDIYVALLSLGFAPFGLCRAPVLETPVFPAGHTVMTLSSEQSDGSLYSLMNLDWVKLI